uniref:Uncharacterized protein n=1 Tax=biofilter metagenome TaxID=1070537 RepID=A0A1A7GE24_9ZZZZ
MEVLKSFRRNGVMYKPGDDLPPDADKPTVEHYRRHGMVGEPAEKKPAAPTRRRAQARAPDPRTLASKPMETKPLLSATTQVGQTGHLGQPDAQTSAAGATQTSAPGDAPPEGKSADVSQATGATAADTDVGIDAGAGAGSSE